MNKYLKIAGVFLTALTLAACGGGSGSGSQGQGTTTFEVENNSPYAVASVQIVNNAGEQVSSQSFSCAAQQTCELKATMNVPGTLLFSDPNGSLMGAYILTSVPGEYQFVRTSRYMLGLYAFTELRKRYPENLDTLLIKLDIFFTNYDSPDRLPDNFQELGMYYRYKMLGTGLSVDNFYEDLHTRLDSGEKLEPSLYQASANTVTSTFASFKDIQWVSLAHASDSPTCPDGLQTAMSVVGEMGGSWIPGLSAVLNVVNTGCEELSSAALDKSLKDINNRLTELAAAMEKTDQKIDNLITLLGESTIGNAVEKMRNLQTDLSAYTSAFSTVIRGSASFKDYVAKQSSNLQPFSSGLKVALSKKDDNLKKVRDLSIPWGILEKMRDVNKTSFALALQNLCDPTTNSSTVDLVKNRASCNMMIGYYKAIMVSSHVLYLKIFKDVTDTLQTYMASDLDLIKTNFIAPRSTGMPDSWTQEYDTQIKPSLVGGLQKAASDFAPSSVATTNGFFKMYGGLPDALVNNLKNPMLGCSMSNADNTTTPSIISWIKNGDDDSYITVNCNMNFKTWTSRYYYRRDGNEILNMMGVVVSANSSARRTTDEKSHYDSMDIYIPDSWKLRLTTSSLPSSGVVLPQMETNSAFYVNSGGTKSGFNKIFTSPNTSVGSNTAVIYSRYTDPNAQADGTHLSYVWGTVFWTGAGIDHRMRSSMMCLTWNCSRNGTQISFKDTNHSDWNGPDSISLNETTVDGFRAFAYDLNGTTQKP